MIIKRFIIFITSFLVFTSAYALEEDAFITDFLWNKLIQLPESNRPKIAVVLGGGGARGVAHIGVLKVLEEEKIPIDIVTGTSVGALVGALYCAGVPIEKLENLGENIGWEKITNLSDTNMVKLLIANHLLSTKEMEKYIERNIGNIRFDELQIPFACVATDLLTGEKVVFKEGRVAPAARASATIPGVFDPVDYRHRYLVDGGLSDNIPTDVAKLLGAEFIIAVSVHSNFSKNDISNVFSVLTQSIYIQGRQLDREKLDIADVVISPGVGDTSSVDLSEARENIEAGVIETRKAVKEIKRMILERTSDYYLFN